MELEFWGVRGTFPVSGKNKVKYGGQTSCASVITSSGGIIIIDAGTGIREVGDRLVKDALMKKKAKGVLSLSILFTHFHLDHVIGLPFFAPLFSREFVINFYSDADSDKAEKYLSGLMSGRYYPLEFKDIKAKIVFKKIKARRFSIGEVKVSCCPLFHPQGSVAYRLEEKEKTVVSATDTEHPQQGLHEKLVALARGASCFIYDATFTPEEYRAGKQGWGHSTWLEGVKLARAAGVQSLYLSHFNPDHADKKIDEIVRLARKRFSQTYAARERLKIIL